VYVSQQQIRYYSLNSIPWDRHSCGDGCSLLQHNLWVLVLFPSTTQLLVDASTL